MSEKTKILSFLISLLFILSSNLFAQEQAKIDSLENLLTSATGKVRFELLIALSTEIVRKDNPYAQKLADEAISIAEDLNDIELKVTAYINKGYMYEGDYKDNEALILFEKALEVSENEGYNKGQAEALYRIGRSYSLPPQRDYVRSDEFLSRALNIAREIKDLKIQGEVQYEQAENIRRSGNIQESLSKFNTAKEIAQKAEDLNTLALIIRQYWKHIFCTGQF